LQIFFSFCQCLFPFCLLTIYVSIYVSCHINSCV
jgi:hypothetical protein